MSNHRTRLDPKSGCLHLSPRLAATQKDQPKDKEPALKGEVEFGMLEFLLRTMWYLEAKGGPRIALQDPAECSPGHKVKTVKINSDNERRQPKRPKGFED